MMFKKCNVMWFYWNSSSTSFYSFNLCCAPQHAFIESLCLWFHCQKRWCILVHLVSLDTCWELVQSFVFCNDDWGTSHTISWYASPNAALPSARYVSDVWVHSVLIEYCSRLDSLFLQFIGEWSDLRFWANVNRVFNHCRSFRCTFL